MVAEKEILNEMKLIYAGVALTILAATLLMMALRRFKVTRSQAPPVAFGLSPIPVGDNSIKSPTSGDAVYWAQLNEWRLEGQSDDRRPMNGSVSGSSGSAGAHRSVARLSHQTMYKEWSKERHD